MSKCFFRLLALVMILAMLPSAYAAELTPPAEQISDNLSYAHYEWRNPVRAADFAIAYVEADIAAVSGGVFISCMTMADREVHVVGGIATIQYWDGNSWETYSQHGFDAYQASQFELNQTVSVPGGCYYRLQVTHTAEMGIDIDIKVSTTQAVYVN